MVEDRINEWISINYGQVADSVQQEISKTFELYFDQFTWWYAEIKTKQIHKP